MTNEENVVVDTSEVEDNISLLLRDKLPDALRDALTEAALICESAAKRKAPVDTGQLRGSISHKVAVDDNGGYAEIGSNLQYAAYVELGTGIYNSSGRKGGWVYKDAKGEWHRTNGMKPHPYLKPAISENKKRIINCFKGRLK